MGEQIVEIIAEIGQNHNGDMELAKELIYACKESGADVAKFQLYDAKALFPKEGNPWYEYNCKTELSMDDLFLLKETCDKAGIEFMSSVFDVERVEWLEKLNVLRYKVASRSIKETDLQNALNKTGKPVLLSLGMWDGDEFPQTPIENPIFLYCISKYPTPLEDLKLKEIDFEEYGGFSDHTIGISATVAAMARGAKIIEKHFTLDKKMYGPDHEGSMTPDELSEITKFKRDFERCL